MKTIFILTFFVVLSANATLIDLGITTGQPASVSEEIKRLNVQIDKYNLSNNPDLLRVVGGGEQTPISNGGASYTINLDGYNGYLMFKWGNADHFYFIQEPANSIGHPWMTATASYNGNGYYTFYSDGPKHLGLSHYTKVVVPEPGSFVCGLFLLLIFSLTKKV